MDCGTGWAGVSGWRMGNGGGVVAVVVGVVVCLLLGCLLGVRLFVRAWFVRHVPSRHHHCRRRPGVCISFDRSRAALSCSRMSSHKVAKVSLDMSPGPRYFCAVCGELATSAKPQVLFDINGPVVSIHHNCMSEQFQPMSRTELMAIYKESHGERALRFAARMARTAAGPPGFDGEPEEVYLVSEFQAALDRYYHQFASQEETRLRKEYPPTFVARVLSGALQTTVKELENHGYIVNNRYGPDPTCAAVRYGLVELKKLFPPPSDPAKHTKSVVENAKYCKAVMVAKYKVGAKHFGAGLESSSAAEAAMVRKKAMADVSAVAAIVAKQSGKAVADVSAVLDIVPKHSGSARVDGGEGGGSSSGSSTGHVRASDGGSSKPVSVVHELKRRYYERFGKNPRGPKCNDVDWLERQLDHVPPANPSAKKDSQENVEEGGGEVLGSGSNPLVRDISTTSSLSLTGMDEQSEMDVDDDLMKDDASILNLGDESDIAISEMGEADEETFLGAGEALERMTEGKDDVPACPQDEESTGSSSRNRGGSSKLENTTLTRREKERFAETVVLRVLSSKAGIGLRNETLQRANNSFDRVMLNKVFPTSQRFQRDVVRGEFQQGWSYHLVRIGSADVSRMNLVQVCHQIKSESSPYEMEFHVSSKNSASVPNNSGWWTYEARVESSDVMIDSYDTSATAHPLLPNSGEEVKEGATSSPEIDASVETCSVEPIPKPSGTAAPTIAPEPAAQDASNEVEEGENDVVNEEVESEVKKSRITAATRSLNSNPSTTGAVQKSAESASEKKKKDSNAIKFAGIKRGRGNSADSARRKVDEKDTAQGQKLPSSRSKRRRGADSTAPTTKETLASTPDHHLTCKKCGKVCKSVQGLAVHVKRCATVASSSEEESDGSPTARSKVVRTILKPSSRTRVSLRNLELPSRQRKAVQDAKLPTQTKRRKSSGDSGSSSDTGRSSSLGPSKKKKKGFLNVAGNVRRSRLLAKTAVSTTTTTRRFPYLNKEVYAYRSPRWLFGIVKDFRPVNVKVGDTVVMPDLDGNDCDGKIRSIKDGKYSVRFKGESDDETFDEVYALKYMKKDVVLEYKVEWANSKVEYFRLEELKTYLTPLRKDDGVVTTFAGEDPSLWVVEYKCISNEERKKLWIYAIRMLKENRDGTYTKTKREEYVTIEDYTPCKISRVGKTKNPNFKLEEPKFW